MKLKLLLLALSLSIPCMMFGGQGIKNAGKHQKNVLIIAKVVENELQAKPEKTDAVHYMAERIDKIGKQALAEGFDTEAYSPEIIEGKEIFTWVPIWEGKNEIPFTLFIYIWPPQGKDATPIHSHPIPCALTVLKNSITQNTYRKTKIKAVRLKETKRLQEGDKEVDLLLDKFIHSVSCQDAGLSPAVTLHLYAEGSSQEVRKTFNKTFSKHIYYDNKEGK